MMSGDLIGNDDDDILSGFLQYGATATGTDFIALHHQDGSESLFELSVKSEPQPPAVTTPEIALRVGGLLVLIVPPISEPPQG